MGDAFVLRDRAGVGVDPEYWVVLGELFCTVFGGGDFSPIQPFPCAEDHEFSLGQQGLA